jgi:hypothetical protein
MSWLFWRRKVDPLERLRQMDRCRAAGDFDSLLAIYDGDDPALATQAGHLLREMIISLRMEVVRKHDDLATDGTRLKILRGIDDRGRQIILNCSAKEAAFIEPGHRHQVRARFVRTARTITGDTQIELCSLP